MFFFFFLSRGWGASVFRVQMNTVCLFTFAADISKHVPLQAFFLLFFLLQIPPVFLSVAMLFPVDQTWQPVFGPFTENIICDVMIGYRC